MLCLLGHFEVRYLVVWGWAWLSMLHLVLDGAELWLRVGIVLLVRVSVPHLLFVAWVILGLILAVVLGFAILIVICSPVE